VSYVKLPLYEDVGQLSSEAICIPVKVIRDWSGDLIDVQMQWNSAWVELRDGLDE
jgi:hypothetical protein